MNSACLSLFLCLVGLAGLLGCQHTPARGQGSSGADAQRNPQWDLSVAQSLEDYFRAHPEVAVYQGRHEYDGRFPDYSQAGLEAEMRRLRADLARARAFDPAMLDAAQRLERAHVLTKLDGDLFWLESARWPWRNPQYYGDAFSPDVYLSRNYAPAAERMRAYTRWCRNLPVAAAQVQTNLSSPMPRSYVDLGLVLFGGLADFLEHDAPELFRGVGAEADQRELAQANADARSALLALEAFFESKRATQTEDFALGAERFSEMLARTEGVHTPLDELQAAAERDLERNLAALRAECARLAPGQPLSAGLAMVTADKPVGSPVQEARTQLASLRAFLVQRDLVDIPGTELALVEEAPPHKRWNFAYIEIPGPFEQAVPSTYCIAPPDPNWSLEEQRNYIPGKADLLFTSVHEVWPGHFLQFLHSNRAPSIFGRCFVGYAFAEGWAHYTEELMWDQGLGDGDPAVHVGQLLNALLRDARMLSAIGLHARGWSLEQSERLFEERGLQDVATARQQAARGSFDPGYLAYTLGKLMILELRKDWQAENPTRSLRDFHDALLGSGGPPLPALRAYLLREDDGVLL